MTVLKIKFRNSDRFGRILWTLIRQLVQLILHQKLAFMYCLQLTFVHCPKFIFIGESAAWFRFWNGREKETMDFGMFRYREAIRKRKIRKCLLGAGKVHEIHHRAQGSLQDATE